MRWNTSKHFVTLLALTLSALGAAGSAHANVSHTFSLLGEVDFPTSPSHDFVWTGAVTIVLDSAADGQYDYGADLVSFRLSGNWESFSEPGVPDFIPFVASVDVAGGRVTSISATYHEPTQPEVTTTFSGMSVFFDQPQIEKSPPSSGTATLTELLAVPEPGAWLPMLGGLVLVAGRRRAGAARHRSPAGPHA